MVVGVGSRMFLGTAAFAAVAGTAYLGTAGDRTGLALFAALLAASLAAGLALLPQTVADGEEAAMAAAEPVGRRDLGEADGPGASLWPLAGALAAGLAGVGLVTSEPMAWTGAGALVTVAAGFYGQGWRQANPDSYALFRQRVLLPVRIPLIAFLVLGPLVLSFSRVLLAVSKTGSVVVAIAVATLVLVVGFAVSLRPSVLSSSLGVGLLLLAAAGVIAGGIVAAAVGEREIGPHGEEHGAAAAGSPAAEVAAQGFAFDQSTLTVPAGAKTFVIRFENKDAGVPHNVAIYPDEQAAGAGRGALFTGKLLTGPGHTDYEVDTPAPGTYFFRCDVHPTMKGDLVVR